MAAGATDAIDVPDEVATTRPNAAAVLVDYDNFFPGPVVAAEVVQMVDSLIRRVLERWPDTRHIEMRLYGGWLDDGLLTNRASELEAALSSATAFPIAHPIKAGLLRGSVQLVTRLAALPDFEWGHTLRTRMGLPRVRLAEQPYPAGCARRNGDCPVKAVQKFAQRARRECGAKGCRVTNEAAFRVYEQKMVDVMLACDTLAYVGAHWDVIVLSSDLDVLPAVALGASQDRGEISLVRDQRYAADLYGEELADYGVAIGEWNHQ